MLKKEDYPLYESFFRLSSPHANPAGWLRDYFEEKTEKEYFVGYVLDGRLVSVCDAPDMPYMEYQMQHTGIVTLSPQWECSIANTASIALAESIGYEKYGIAYILKE